jgi:hypothetical protein
MKIKITAATGRPNLDKRNNASLNSPLHLAYRFLHREAYTGRDLYNEAMPSLNLKGGTLSVDDSVLDKP